MLEKGYSESFGRQVPIVKAGYEDAWGQIYQQVHDLVQSGVRNIGAVLYELLRKNATDGDISGAQFPISGVARDHKGRLLSTVVHSAGAYVAVPRFFQANFIQHMVMDSVTEETNVVLELGCGYGKNIFQSYLLNPQRQLKYYAFELTDSGRRTADLIASMDSNLDLTTVPFNFHRPDFSVLDNKPNVVGFTYSAIEQVTLLNPKIFDLLMEKTNKCIFLHAEPVGWQRDPEAREAYQKIVDRKGSPQFDPQDRPVVSMAKNCAFNGYNMNLISLLNHYEIQGKIKIHYCHYDFFGENPFAPETLIAWEKIPRSSQSN